MSQGVGGTSTAGVGGSGADGPSVTVARQLKVSAVSARRSRASAAGARKSRASGNALIALLAPTVRRMLRHGVGVDALIRAATQAYIRTAIAELFPEEARVNVSRLSVVTGMPRPRVSALVVKQSKNGKAPKPLKVQGTLRVLRGWHTDPRFHNEKGRPAELSLRGDRPTFAMLVKRHGGDVTPIAVLRELERLNAIATHHGRVRLRPAGLRALELAHCAWLPTDCD